MCETSMGHDAEMDMLVESAGMTEDTWVSSDGRHIKYEDLTDSHLRNILGYLQRQSLECTVGLTVVNGEQAGYALEDEIRRIEGNLDGLLLECDRRGWSRAAALLGAATSRKERWDEVD
ncbi:hypothetical protein LCGC14_2464950 [marine sediment metagenome]|uniref:Uncharacterized protein n=1 Tax=marine sediment metagenome TaxID=412755 RepID=A0A0F9BC42_9ZZZZ